MTHLFLSETTSLLVRLTHTCCTWFDFTDAAAVFDQWSDSDSDSETWMHHGPSPSIWEGRRDLNAQVKQREGGSCLRRRDPAWRDGAWWVTRVAGMTKHSAAVSHCAAMPLLGTSISPSDVGLCCHGGALSHVTDWRLTGLYSLHCMVRIILLLFNRDLSTCNEWRTYECELQISRLMTRVAAADGCCTFHSGPKPFIR